MRRIAMLAVCFGLLAPPVLAQTKAQMQKLDDQFAYAVNTGNAAAVAAMYTKDAYVLPPGGPMVHDPAAIQKLWEGAIADMQDIKCTAIDVKPLGSGAAREIGTCSFMTKKPPLKELQVKYAVVWQKEGASWKLLQDIWNSDK